jgi:hypothetical protein
MKKSISILVAVLAGSFLLFSCGGGSDGAGGGGGGGFTYTGPTTPAALTQENAQVMTQGALENAMSSVGVDLNRPRLNRAREMDTITGECGGTASYDLMVSVKDQSFEGQINFIDFCNYGVITNGLADLTGTFDIQARTFLTAAASFEILNMTYAEVSRGMTGTIAYTRIENGFTVEMDYAVFNSVTENVRQAEDIVVYVTEIEGGRSLTAAGGFCHPDYGCVTFETTTPFVLNNGATRPASGVLVVTGANNAVVTLTVIDETAFRLEADFDGDGQTDWTSQDIPWPV